VEGEDVVCFERLGSHREVEDLLGRSSFLHNLNPAVLSTLWWLGLRNRGDECMELGTRVAIFERGSENLVWNSDFESIGPISDRVEFSTR
jgi:hypothetical protein